MDDKTGRNDPCPCGSGKKYKSCCMNKTPFERLKNRISVLNKPKEKVQEGPVNLMTRTFGESIEQPQPEENLVFNDVFPSVVPPPSGEVSPLGIPKDKYEESQ